MAGSSAEGRGGLHNTHEEHESFLSHTAEKFHLKKTAGSITRKTVRCADAARSLMLRPAHHLHAEALSGNQHWSQLPCKQAESLYLLEQQLSGVFSQLPFASQAIGADAAASGVLDVRCQHVVPVRQSFSRRMFTRAIAI